MPSVIYIYGLVDPRTSKVRYVGASQKPKKRVMPARHVKGKYKKAWFIELETIGLRPLLRIFEEIPLGSDWESREKFWISEFGGTDALLNESTGGRGPIGVVRSPETCKKMSDRLKGNPHNWTEDGRRRAAATQFKPGVNNFERLPIDAQDRIRAAGRKNWENVSLEERSRMATERNLKTWGSYSPKEKANRIERIAEGIISAARRARDSAE